MTAFLDLPDENQAAILADLKRAGVSNAEMHAMLAPIGDDDDLDLDDDEPMPVLSSSPPPRPATPARQTTVSIPDPIPTPTPAPMTPAERVLAAAQAEYDAASPATQQMCGLKPPTVPSDAVKQGLDALWNASGRTGRDSFLI